MSNARRNSIAIICMLSMLFLMLNSKDSLNFAKDALELCFQSLIPSLFPFIFLSILISNALTNTRIPFLRILGKICKIPPGHEILFLLGILGGYPIGAQVIVNAYRCGSLKKDSAERMLGFCNNAGPAFIFGIVGPMFDSMLVSVLLWAIQIISAILTGMLLKGTHEESSATNITGRISITTVLERSIKSMGIICGWVILFRILIGFVVTLTSAFLPESMQILISGTLELTNGCVDIPKINDEGIGFVLAALFLSMGGICVALQTVSTVKPLKIKFYLKGKVIQTVIAVFLAYILQSLVFQSVGQFTGIIALSIFLAAGAVITIIFTYSKKTVAFCK